jgi:acetyl-CoA carboxylase biotin carboxyl carrier protein
MPGPPTSSQSAGHRAEEAMPEGAVTSPMVGTVYVAPEPNAPHFVQVGDEVHEGQTLLIIEAMKVMNPLPSPRAGKVTRVLVDNGDPVEYGELLMVIE